MWHHILFYYYGFITIYYLLKIKNYLGAGKRTLRQVYLGYVRSAIDYALPLKEIATRQAKEYR